MVRRSILLANLLAVASASPLYHRNVVAPPPAGDSVDTFAASAVTQLADVTKAMSIVDLATIEARTDVPIDAPISAANAIIDAIASAANVTTAAPTSVANATIEARADVPIDAPISAANAIIDAIASAANVTTAAPTSVANATIEARADVPTDLPISAANAIIDAITSAANVTTAAPTSVANATVDAPTDVPTAAPTSVDNATTDAPSPTANATTAAPTDAPAPTSAPSNGTAAPDASATVSADGVSVPSLAADEGAKNDGAPDTYTFFKGDGKDGWPTRDQWISFDEMFKRNAEVMGQGCVNDVTPNTPEDNDNIKKAILEIAPAAQVDPRFILASVMQESNGCVRIQGTPSGEPGVFNPGLMQTFKGTGTCNVDNQQELSPCPLDQITQMIIDGVQGTVQDGTAQAGLVQHLNDVGGDANGQVYYAAARKYNSGTVPDLQALESAGQCGPPRTFGVPCYSSDIANRLMGWVKGATQCDLKPAASC